MDHLVERADSSCAHLGWVAALGQAFAEMNSGNPLVCALWTSDLPTSAARVHRRHGATVPALPTNTSAPPPLRTSGGSSKRVRCVWFDGYSCAWCACLADATVKSRGVAVPTVL